MQKKFLQNTCRDIIKPMWSNVGGFPIKENVSKLDLAQKDIIIMTAFASKNFKYRDF